MGQNTNYNAMRIHNYNKYNIHHYVWASDKINI